MKIHSPWLLRLGGLVGATLIRTWHSSLDTRVSFYDPTVDPFHPDFSGNKIFVVWHEYLTVPTAFRSHCDLALLLSQHRDAQILAEVAGFCGFECVRGSTNRGSIGALQELCQRSERLSLVITPDGPRGPRRRMTQGPIFLSSRLGLPIVCMGIGLDRPWRLKSWDRFAIARPGSRLRAVIGPTMCIPSDVNRGGIEHYRQQAERMLNRLTLEAEAWAESGVDKAGSIPVRKSYHAENYQSRRLDTAHAAAPPHRSPTGARTTIRER